MISQIQKDQYIFAFKTLLSALIVLYISLAENLTNPGWAITTVFIVSQPFTSTSFTKGLYRILGTMLGSFAAIFIISSLLENPSIVVLAIAIWVAGCLYLSLCDRSPRSYMFMLAGYTIGFVAFPYVDNPNNVFSAGIDRIQEISLGVVVSTVIHTVLFPKNIFNSINDLLDQWLKNIENTLPLLFKNENDFNSELKKIAIFPLNVEKLSDHLKYGSKLEKYRATILDHLHHNMSKILPIINSIRYRIEIIKLENIHPDIIKLLKNVANIHYSKDKSTNFKIYRQEIYKLERNIHSCNSNQDIASAALIEIINDLIQILEKIHHYYDELHQPYIKKHIAILYKKSFINNHLSLLSAIAVFTTVIITCELWIQLSWTNVSTLPMMAAVACSFFSTIDNPVTTIKYWLKYVIFSIVIVLFYAAFILPAVNSIETALLVFIPLFLILSILISRPSTSFIGMVMAANIATLMGINNHYTATFTDTLNMSLASITGVSIAIYIMYLIRTRTPEQVANQVISYANKDLLKIINLKKINNISEFYDKHMNKTLDKIFHILPRLSSAKIDNFDRNLDIFNLLRIGVNIIKIKQYNLQNNLIDELLSNITAYISSNNNHNSAKILNIINKLQEQDNIKNNKKILITLYNLKISFQ